MLNYLFYFWGENLFQCMSQVGDFLQFFCGTFVAEIQTKYFLTFTHTFTALHSVLMGQRASLLTVCVC